MKPNTRCNATLRSVCTFTAITLTVTAATNTHAIIWSGDHPSSPNWDASQSLPITFFTNWDGSPPIPPINDHAQFGNHFPSGGFDSGTPTLNGSRQMLTLSIDQDGDQPILADSNDTLTLLNGIVTRSPDSTGTQSIGSTIHQLSDSLWTIDGTGAGSLHMNAAINGTGSLTKLGTHELRLAGSDPNTYAGPTIVSAGTLTLAKPPDTNAVPGTTIINGPATIRHDPTANEQLPNAAPLILNHPDALYDLNGATETITDITQTGSVHLGGGTLNLTDYDANGGAINLQNGTLNITNPDAASPAPTADSALTPTGVNISNAIFSLHATTLTANGLNDPTSPTPGQTITIDNNATLTTSGPATINLIGGADTSTGNSANGGTLNLINGTFNLAAAAKLNAQGGADDEQDSPGHAGSISVADATATIDGTVNLNGLNGANAFTFDFPFPILTNAKRGSDAGTISLTSTANVTINGTLNLRGGNGGEGAVGGAGSTAFIDGAPGRHGGIINVQGGTLTFDNAATADLTGGNGGNGAADDGILFGGNGGNAGNGGTLDISNGDVYLLGNAAIDLTRGTPGTPGVSVISGTPGAPGTHGAVNLTGGSLTLTAGLITADNTTTPSTDPINLIGTTLTLSDTSHLTLNDNTTLKNANLNITAPATLTTQPDKSLALDPDATLTTDTDTTINTTTINNGTINAPPAPDALTFTNTLSGQGNYTGHIQIQNTYAPGNSTAVNNITGDLTLATTATLTIEVLSNATPVPGTDHDQINITENVTLSGTLNVIPLPDPETFDDTFPGALGTTYDILSYTTRAGFFTNITGTLLNTAFALAPLINETDDTLQLRATIPGDLNLDNTVSLADLSTFALNFNTTPGLYNDSLTLNSWQLGDFNTDGAITVADLSLLALNFGFDADDPTSTPLGLSLHDVATLAGLDPTTIPEPASALLALITTSATISRRPTKKHPTHTQK